MRNNRLTRALGRKVRLGHFGLPVWAIGLAAMGIAAVAGQAVGPVLAGSVTGSAALTVRQTLLLDNSRAPTTAGTDDSAVVMNDERTEFVASMVLQVGQTTALCIYLENESAAQALARLELSVPAGVDVEVTQFSEAAGAATTNDCSTGSMGADDSVVKEAQFSKTLWVVTADSSGTGTGTSSTGNGDDEGIRIVIEPKDDLNPGYYTIKGRLVQTAH